MPSNDVQWNGNPLISFILPQIHLSKKMKLFIASIAAALATSASAAGIRLSGKVDSSKLLSKAIKVDPKTLRRLDQNNQNQNQVISADKSIMFNSCTSLSTAPQNEDVMFGDNYIAYTKNGQIVSEKSYVLFNVCETDNCIYQAADEDLYMVDLATYMESMGEYLPTQRKNYCEACQDSQDYCQ